MPPDTKTLRETIRRLERAAPRGPDGVVPVAPAIDAWLPGGGLARGALHELFAADAGAATGFAAMLAGRCDGPVLWLSPARAAGPYAPGLAAFGLAPGALVVVQAAAEDLLWAAEEALRSPAPGAVIVLGTAVGLTAGRRLQLAAEQGGGFGLFLRPDADQPGASAARTRWRIGAMPGAGKAGAAAAPHALAPPRWRIALLHARGGRPATWVADWQGAALAASTRLAA
jgi:protein ImuA